MTQETKNRATFSRVFAGIGTILAYAPLPFFFIVIFSLIVDAESILAQADGDPRIVAGEISQRLVPVVLLLVVGLFGLLISLCTAGFGRYRAKWFFVASVAASVFYFLAFPVGTVLAIVFAIVLWIKRKEFLTTAATHEVATE